MPIEPDEYKLRVALVALGLGIAIALFAIGGAIYFHQFKADICPKLNEQIKVVLCK